MTRAATGFLTVLLLAGGVCFGAEPDAEKKVKARQLEKQGTEAREKRDYELAVKLFRQAIVEDPQPLFRFLLAENLLSLDREKEALEEYRRFLDDEDGRSPLQADKARAEIGRRVLPKLTKDQEKQLDSAVADYTSWVNNGWDPASTHLDNFIPKAEALLKQQPDHLPTWKGLGHAYRIKKDYAKAADAYTKFLDGSERLKYPVEREELKQIRIAAQMTKGFAETGAKEKKLPALDATGERALTDINDHVEASRENRPDILTDKAIPLMERFCDRHPGYTPVLKMLGDAYYETAQWLKAEDMYLRCLEANDKNGGLLESERKAVAKNRILCDGKIPPSSRYLIATIPWNGTDKTLYWMKFSPDGKLVAMSGSESRGQIRIADSGTGQVITSMQCEGMVYGLGYAFSPDSRQMAVSVKVRGLLKMIEVREVDTGKLVKKIEGSESQGHRIAFGPDGKRLIWSNTGKQLKSWDFESSTSSVIQEVPSIAGPFAFNPKNEDIAYATDKSVAVWDGKVKKTEAMPALHRWGVTALAFTPDGKKLVSASDDSTLVLWDVEARKAAHTLNGHSKKEVLCVAVSPDGTLIASGGKDDSVVLWDANSGKSVISLPGHSGGVMAVWFDPSGRILLSAGGDGVRVWRTKLDRLAK